MCKKIFGSIAALLLVFVLVFAVFHEKLLTVYAESFTVDTATKGADAIFILGGNPKTRPAKAVELAKDGYGNNIFMTKIKDKALKYQSYFIPEEQLTANILKSEELKLSMIPCIKEEGATSTFDEAYSLAKYVKENKLEHVIIVTDAFHTRRALYAFKKVFKLQGVDAKLESAPAYNGVYLESNWWKTEKGLRSYIIEPIKFFFYVFNSRNLKSVEG